MFGQVASVDQGDKVKGQPSLGVTLTDIEVGGHVVAITTQPVVVKGDKGTGAKKMLGGAALGAGIGAIADGGQGAAIGAGVGLAAGGVATAASLAGRGHHRLPSRSSRSPCPCRSRCRRRRRWPSTERPDVRSP